MPWSRLPTSDATGDEQQPVPMRDLVDSVLAGLGAPSVDALVAIHEAWARIVGDELVAHAHPISIESGCLRIAVDSPAWASHLRWAEAEIVARAERVVGAGVVTSVQVRTSRRR